MRLLDAPRVYRCTFYVHVTIWIWMKKNRGNIKIIYHHYITVDNATLLSPTIFYLSKQKHNTKSIVITQNRERKRNIFSRLHVYVFSAAVLFLRFAKDEIFQIIIITNMIVFVWQGVVEKKLCNFCMIIYIHVTLPLSIGSLTRFPSVSLLLFPRLPPLTPIISFAKVKATFQSIFYFHYYTHTFQPTSSYVILS